MYSPDDSGPMSSGQPDPGQSRPINLGVLAEIILASEEHWALLAEVYTLMGREILEVVE